MDRKAVTKVELLKELESKNDLIESIYNLLEVVTQTNELIVMYDKILEIAIHTIKNATYGSLFVKDKGDYFVIACVSGFNRDTFKDMRFNIEETSMYKETNGLMDQTCIVNDIFNYNKDFFSTSTDSAIKEIDDVAIKTTIMVPIRFQNKVIAILNLDSTKKNAFDDVDKHNLELFAMETSNIIRINHLLSTSNYLSTHDELTKVFNRRYYKQLVNKSLEIGDKFQMALLDIDNLKNVNDNYGHIFGDYFIKTFAEIVDSVISKYGVFSRFGGDEFNIIVPSNIEDILDEVNFKILESTMINELKISYSYGIANYPDDGKDYDELFKVADSRMYKNKKIKKNIS
jgi:diguanylate cyclase (GGDEF)-like protein